LARASLARSGAIRMGSGLSVKITVSLLTAGMRKRSLSLRTTSLIPVVLTMRRSRPSIYDMKPSGSQQQAPDSRW